MRDFIEPNLQAPPLNVVPGLSEEALAPWRARGISRFEAVGEWLYRMRWSAGEGAADELDWLCRHFLAREDLDRAIETGDGAVVRLMEAGRHDEAERLLDELLARREDFALLHSKGLLLMGRDRLDAAHQVLERAAALAGESSGIPGALVEASAIHGHLATLHLRRGAMLKALGASERAQALALESGDPDRVVEASLALARLYRQQGGDEEARETLVCVAALPSLASDVQARAELWTGFLELFSPAEVGADLQTEALTSIAGAGRWQSLAGVLHDLARHALTRETLEPAFCLNLAVHAPLIRVVDLAGGLLQKEADLKRPEAPLIAAATVARVEQTPRDYPRYPHIHRMSVVQLVTVARHQGVPEAAVKRWARDERLYLEDDVIGRCIGWFLENGCTARWPVSPQVIAAAVRDLTD